MGARAAWRSAQRSPVRGEMHTHNRTSDTPGTPVVRIRDLVFRRGNRTILDGVDIDIPRGTIVAFMSGYAPKDARLHHALRQLLAP